MVVNQSKNIFVTFGAGRSGWTGAAKRITAEAEKTGLFEFCFNLDEHWLKTWDPAIYKIGLGLRKTLPPRGFGYWTWKPSILLWAHLNFPSHQVVYVDAGSQFSPGSLIGSELESDLRLAFNNKGLAWALEEQVEEKWTKADLVAHLSLSAEITGSAQVQSGFIALSPLWDRGSLIAKWREIALVESGILFTDISKRRNSVSFVEHRHDQSALSCLWKIHHFPIIHDKTQPNRANEYSLLAWRNNSRLTIESSSFLRRLNKFKNLCSDLITLQK